MTRNAGSSVDTQARRVRDRNGLSYPLERVVVGEDGLYYARPIDGNDLFWYQERWLLPRSGWVVNRFAFFPNRDEASDWYIETDIIEAVGDMWEVRDGYLDVYVHDGVRYELEDAGELADGIVSGEISLDDAIAALRALDGLCEALRSNGSSGRALLKEFAPSLPEPRLRRGPDGVFSLVE